MIDSLLYRPITIPASARRHERTRNQRSQVQVTFKMSLSASSRKSKTVLQPVEPFLRPHSGGFHSAITNATTSASAGRETFGISSAQVDGCETSCKSLCTRRLNDNNSSTSLGRGEIALFILGTSRERETDLWTLLAELARRPKW